MIWWLLGGIMIGGFLGFVAAAMMAAAARADELHAMADRLKWQERERNNGH